MSRKKLINMVEGDLLYNFLEYLDECKLTYVCEDTGYLDGFGNRELRIIIDIKSDEDLQLVGSYI